VAARGGGEDGGSKKSSSAPLAKGGLPTTSPIRPKARRIRAAL
jgi:hypothetical protein